MSEQYPLCPYCGKIMHPFRNGGVNDPDIPPYWYACTDDKCFSTAPLAQTYDEALAFALRRPPQKPLTLEELHALIDTGEEAVTYCEAKDDPQTYACIWYDGKSVDRDAEAIDNGLLVYEHYGIDWRAWANRPTDEERAAAPWEE